MPSLNIFTTQDKVKPLENILPNLRAHIAGILSCGERKLHPAEMSLRIIVPSASMQIADTELEIKAHAYAPRVQRQDEICRSIRDYVTSNCPQAGSVYVWLQLSELGHSADE